MRIFRNILILLFLFPFLVMANLGLLLNVFSGPLVGGFRGDLKKSGIALAPPRIASVKPCSWKALCLEHGVANFEILRKDSLVANRKIEVALDRLRVEIEPFKEENIFVHGEGFHAFVLPFETGPRIPQDLVEARDFKFRFALNFKNPARAQRQLHELVRDLAGLVTEGRCRTDVEVSATSYFAVQEVPLQADLDAEHAQAGTRLVMKREDLIAVSRSLKEKLSEAEIDLLSENPMRAAGLLRIRNEAIDTAVTEVPNSEGLKDAYRHVLWAYLLTQAYGETFARKVMDAHEKGSAIPNTPEQRHMDKVNNEIGIRYAKAGTPQESLLKLTQGDSQVIRDKA